MLIKKFLLPLLLLLTQSTFLYSISLVEQFRNTGYVEIYDTNNGSESFNTLYTYFDTLLTFLQTNPTWVQKLYIAKERFIRSNIRSCYSTDFFGFYDESQQADRRQISFYYSSHFHVFVCRYYPEFNNVPEIITFLEKCFEIQKPYINLFNHVAAELGIPNLFSSDLDQPPILLKVIKYLPSYIPNKPHYDGTALTLLLDSTDSDSLLFSPYKSLLTINDFSPAIRKFSRDSEQNSSLLIPGTLIAEFGINPIPHIVIQSGKTRYATIAFAMRPNYTQQKQNFTDLPSFGS